MTDRLPRRVFHFSRSSIAISLDSLGSHKVGIPFFGLWTEAVVFISPKLIVPFVWMGFSGCW